LEYFRDLCAHHFRRWIAFENECCTEAAVLIERYTRQLFTPQAQEAAFQKSRDEFGHTPLSIAEKIPWKCQRRGIGTGAYGRLPVMKEVKAEAERRQVELLVVPTREALRLMERESKANAILDVTYQEPLTLRLRDLWAMVHTV
jgi:hypothetical protein